MYIRGSGLLLLRLLCSFDTFMNTMSSIVLASDHAKVARIYTFVDRNPLFRPPSMLLDIRHHLIRNNQPRCMPSRNLLRLNLRASLARPINQNLLNSHRDRTILLTK